MNEDLFPTLSAEEQAEYDQMSNYYHQELMLKAEINAMIGAEMGNPCYKMSEDDRFFNESEF